MSKSPSGKKKEKGLLSVFKEFLQRIGEALGELNKLLFPLLQHLQERIRTHYSKEQTTTKQDIGSADKYLFARSCGNVLCDCMDAVQQFLDGTGDFSVRTNKDTSQFETVLRK